MKKKVIMIYTEIKTINFTSQFLRTILSRFSTATQLNLLLPQ
jgi:hypothetical protein